jgi:hypothetical protein
MGNVAGLSLLCCSIVVAALNSERQSDNAAQVFLLFYFYLKFRMEIMPNNTKCRIESNTKIYEITRNFAKIRQFSFKISTFAKFQKSLS